MSIPPDDIEDVFDMIDELEEWVELKRESSRIQTIMLVLISHGAYLAHRHLQRAEWANDTIKDAVQLGIIRLKKERGE